MQDDLCHRGWAGDDEWEKRFCLMCFSHLWLAGPIFLILWTNEMWDLGTLQTLLGPHGSRLSTEKKKIKNSSRFKWRAFHKEWTVPTHRKNGRLTDMANRHNQCCCSLLKRIGPQIHSLGQGLIMLGPTLDELKLVGVVTCTTGLLLF